MHTYEFRAKSRRTHYQTAINFTSVRERRGSIDCGTPFIIYNFQYVGHVNLHITGNI